MKRMLILSACAALMGCAGINEALQYDDVPVKTVMNMDGTWRIFDKPREGRLMITPTYGRAAGKGFVGGLTFGIASTEIPRAEYQAGAESWLVSTSRICKVTDGHEIISPQWEFKYSCQSIDAAVEAVPIPGGRIAMDAELPPVRISNPIQSASLPSPKPNLGITGSSVTRDDAGPTARMSDPHGAWVETVLPGSAAANAGIKHADVIQTFNGHRVQTYPELNAYTNETIPGTTVSLGVWRNGEIILLHVDL
jgi:hypothetical protein